MFEVSFSQASRKVEFYFPGGSDGKPSVYNVGDSGSISGWGRAPGERNGNPIQVSCMENPMDRGAWQAAVQESQRDTTKVT